jgi:hypothetical protein
MHMIATRPTRSVKSRLSPISEDIIREFQILNVGISGMLSVFFVGRLVMNLAEQSIVDEQKHTSGYDQDNDLNSDSESD